MALITGAPVGNIVSTDEIYLEGAPNIYFQSFNGATLLNNPDADGFYWGLSGTTTYPVYQLGCYENVRLGDNLAVADVRCDSIGVKSTIQKRNYLELDMTVKTILPLSIFSKLTNGGAVTLSGKVEKMGLGRVNNNQYWKVYMPKVYDELTGDHVSFTLHKCQFVEAFQLNFAYGAPWTFGFKIRAFANDVLPDAQLFATVIRADPSAL